MKKLILFLIPVTLLNAEVDLRDSAENTYQYNTPSVDEEIRLDDKVNVFELVSKMKSEKQACMAEGLLRTEFLVNYLEHQKKVLANKMVLLQYEHGIRKSELEMQQKEQKVKEDFHNREMQIAAFFHASNTCKLDGRSWFELSEEERRMYRENYHNYNNISKR